MNEDMALLLTVFLGALIFMGVHIAVFRKAKNSGSVYWLLNAFVGSWAVALITGLMIIITIFGWNMFYIGIYGVLISLMVAAYMFGIFTLIDSSIRLKFFFDIARHKNGVTRGQLLKDNTAEVILKRRLTRLVDSGEIMKKRSQYSRAKSFSLVIVREGIARVFEHIYF